MHGWRAAIPSGSLTQFLDNSDRIAVQENDIRLGNLAPRRRTEIDIDCVRITNIAEVKGRTPRGTFVPFHWLPSHPSERAFGKFGIESASCVHCRVFLVILCYATGMSSCLALGRKNHLIPYRHPRIDQTLVPVSTTTTHPKNFVQRSYVSPLPFSCILDR